MAALFRTHTYILTLHTKYKMMTMMMMMVIMIDDDDDDDDVGVKMTELAVEGHLSYAHLLFERWSL